MDTTNLVIVGFIAVIAFFSGMEMKEYQMKAEARAFASELVKGLAQ